MSQIDIAKSSETSDWVIGLAESHNANHQKLEQMMGIVGITLPQLISLESARQDQNFHSQRAIREELTPVLSKGVKKLTMDELKKIPSIVWKINSPDQKHFRTFFRDQVHDHPGLTLFASVARSEFSRRTAKLANQNRLEAIDQLDMILGNYPSLFNFAREFIK